MLNGLGSVQSPTSPLNGSRTPASFSACDACAGLAFRAATTAGKFSALSPMAAATLAITSAFWSFTR